MFSSNQYIPILKGKAGEFTALNILNKDLLKDVVPIIDIVPTLPKKTFDKHITVAEIYFTRFWKLSKAIPFHVGYSILMSNQTAV